MTYRQRLIGIVSVTALSFLIGIGLTSCASTKHQSFATSFLPPTPIPDPDVRIEEPPHVTSSVFTSEIPILTPRNSPEVERRLKLAEERFQAGRKAYQDGDVALARQEFDRSLDVLLSAPEHLDQREKLENRLDELVDSIYKYDLDELGAGDKKQAVVYDKSPLDGMLEMTFPIDPKLKPKVSEEISATVSQLPLEQNDTVLSYIHYFSTERGRKTLIAGLRRAGRYKDLIQRILDEEGVPRELMCLAQAESGFLPRAISYKKATGMWQFMQYSGKEYGLQQSPNCDDRLDPEKATRAAARHLRDLYAMFGDWYLAMAAYNCGPGCVDRAVQRTGYADFWELSNRNALPRQTMHYVPLILAITIMTKNPKDYGLEGIDTDRPIDYDTIELKVATNLDLIGDITGRPVAEVRDLNPALLSAVAPARYPLHVPKGSSTAIEYALESIPATRRASWRLHRVEPGETLAEIANHYHLQASAIASVNSRTVEGPETGDLLIIPAAAEPARPAHTRARTSPRRTFTSSISPRVLHHRATTHTLKTAALDTHRQSAQ